jgi:hypothetical protein
MPAPGVPGWALVLLGTCAAAHQYLRESPEAYNGSVVVGLLPIPGGTIFLSKLPVLFALWSPHSQVLNLVPQHTWELRATVSDGRVWRWLHVCAHASIGGRRVGLRPSGGMGVLVVRTWPRRHDWPLGSDSVIKQALAPVWRVTAAECVQGLPQLTGYKTSEQAGAGRGLGLGWGFVRK